MQGSRVFGDRAHNRLHLVLSGDLQEQDIRDMADRVRLEARKLRRNFVVSIQDDNSSFFPPLLEGLASAIGIPVRRRRDQLRRILAPIR